MRFPFNDLSNNPFYATNHTQLRQATNHTKENRPSNEESLNPKISKIPWQSKPALAIKLQSTVLKLPPTQTLLLPRDIILSIPQVYNPERLAS